MRRSLALLTAARRLLVAVRISKSAPATGAAGTVLVVTGAVSPVKADRAIGRYQVLSGGRLQLLASVKVATNSTYRLTKKLARGTYTLQVGLGATPGNAAGSVRFAAKRT